MTDGPSIPPPPPSAGSSNLVSRAINILTKPASEWRAADGEAASIGGLIGAALARYIGHEHAKHLDEHLQHGGLLLWVRTRDADRERQALEILRRHSAHDVHLHQIPERACKESDVPRERPRVVHLLDREYSLDFLGPVPRP